MHRESEFLQSEQWLRFQESTGRDIVRCSGEDFSANGIVHELPLVGKYLYVPRGPVMPTDGNRVETDHEMLLRLIAGARAIGAAWVRIEPRTDAELERIREGCGEEVVKAPHDMQPREVFVMDVSKPDAELLAEMKPKTRYNIRLAEKKGVHVVASEDEEYREAFVDLVYATARRKHIIPHPSAYYRKMLDAFLGETGTLFVAIHDGDILGINLVIRHGDTATYLHGGSGEAKHGYMAPFLLQWAALRDARDSGCAWYDFGGVKMTDETRNGKRRENEWEGITRFKKGFSPATLPRCFPGAYDIILDRHAYRKYTLIRVVRENIVRVRKLIRLQ